MAQVKFEQPFATDAERSFAENITALLNTAVFTDCRNSAKVIRTLCEPCGVDMIIGCGGSHVYIHRASEFVAGDNTNPKNIRWAIITD